MSYLYTGEKGIPLKDIIKSLGNKNYKYIECRCKYISENGQEQDDLFGACSYINGELSGKNIQKMNVFVLLYGNMDICQINGKWIELMFNCRKERLFEQRRFYIIESR